MQMFNYLQEIANVYGEPPKITKQQVLNALILTQLDRTLFNKLIFFDENSEVEEEQRGGIQLETNDFTSKSLSIFRSGRNTINQVQNDEINEILKKKLDQFYLNDILSPSQIISSEFKNFPRYYQHQEYADRIQKLESHSIIIAQHLNINCMKHYDNIAIGCQQIDDIDSIITQDLQKIKFNRQVIDTVRQQVVIKGLFITNSQIKIQNINKTLTVLKKLQIQYSKLLRKFKQFDDNSNICSKQILNLINVINSEESVDSPPLQCLKNKEFFLQQQINKLKQKVQQQCVVLHRQFNENQFILMLSNYFHMEQQKYQDFDDLKSFYPQVLSENINYAFQQTMEYMQIESGGYLMNQYVQPEKAIIFYQQLYQQFSNIMYNYNLVHKWFLGIGRDEVDFSQYCDNQQETNQFKQYQNDIKLICQEIKKQFWIEIQQKIEEIIESMCLINALPIENYIIFLKHTNTFLLLGEEFSNTKGQRLITCVIQKLENYLKVFHNEQIQNLFTYIQNEDWSRLPFQSNYEHKEYYKFYQQNQNFQSLKESVKSFFPSYKTQDISNIKFQDLLMKESLLLNWKQCDIFELKTFKKNLEIPLEIKAIGYDQEVVLCSSSHKLLKIIEKYCELLLVLIPINNLIFQNLLEILQTYIYIIINMWISKIKLDSLVRPTPIQSALFKYDEDKDVEEIITTYENFQQNLKFREEFDIIKKFIIKNSYQIEKNIQNFELNLINQYNQQLNQITIVSEGLKFINTNFDYLYQIISQQVGEYPLQQQNINNLLTIIPKLLYKNYFEDQYIKPQNIYNQIHQIKWELKEKGTDSAYIDRLIQYVVDQREKLPSIGGGCIPLVCQEFIHEELIKFNIQQLLIQYSKIKKINNKGFNQIECDLNFFNKFLQTNKQQNSVNFLQEHAIQFIQAQYIDNIVDLLKYIRKKKEIYPIRTLLSLLQTSMAGQNLQKNQRKEYTTIVLKEYNQYLKEKLIN